MGSGFREHSEDTERSQLIAFLRPWAEKSKLAREILACAEKASMVEDMKARTSVNIEVAKPRRCQFRYNAKPIEAAKSGLDHIRDVLNEAFSPLWDLVSYERGGAFETQIPCQWGVASVTLEPDLPVWVGEMTDEGLGEGDLMLLRQVPVGGKFYVHSSPGLFNDERSPGKWEMPGLVRSHPRSTITLVVEFPAVGVEWMRAKAALNKAGCFDIMDLSQ